MINKSTVNIFIKDEIEMMMTEDSHVYSVDDYHTALEFYLADVLTTDYTDYISKCLGTNHTESMLIKQRIIEGISSRIYSIWFKPCLWDEAYNPNDEFEVRDYRNEY